MNKAKSTTFYKGKIIPLVSYYIVKGIPYKQCPLCQEELALTCFTMYSREGECDFCIQKRRTAERKASYQAWLIKKKQQRRS